MFFLTYISFSLHIDLVSFKTNNKHHFLTYTGAELGIFFERGQKMFENVGWPKKIFWGFRLAKTVNFVWHSFNNFTRSKLPFLQYLLHSHNT